MVAARAEVPYMYRVAAAEGAHAPRASAVHDVCGEDAIRDECGDEYVPMILDPVMMVHLESMGLAPQVCTEKVALVEVYELPADFGPLEIEQDPSISSQGIGGTGGVVWEASLASIHFLVDWQREQQVQFDTILELGR